MYLKEKGTFTVPYVMVLYPSISPLSELNVGVRERKDIKSLVLLLQLIKKGLYKFLLSFLIQMKLLKVDEQLFLAQTGENQKIDKAWWAQLRLLWNTNMDDSHRVWSWETSHTRTRPSHEDSTHLGRLSKWRLLRMHDARGTLVIQVQTYNFRLVTQWLCIGAQWYITNRQLHLQQKISKDTWLYHNRWPALGTKKRQKSRLFSLSLSLNQLLFVWICLYYIQSHEAAQGL